MKKRLSFLVSLLMILGSFALVGCDTNKPVDDGHHYATEYSSDGTYHFYACTDPGCTARKGEERCSGGTATCVEYAICDVCGHTHGEFDLDNHDLEHHKAKEPTETEVGWNEYDTCKREGCNYTTYVEIPATGPTHHFSEEWTSENGTHFHICTDPGCSATTEPIKCSGGEATCVSPAICEVCKGTYGDIDSDNHDLEQHSAKEPSCTEIGWNEYDTCKREGCDYSTYVEIDSGHNYVDGVCTKCGKDKPLYLRVDTEGKEDANGDYILFGSYPQTLVSDNTIINTLNDMSGTLPTSSNAHDWTSYKYYIDESKKNYMWYIDITLEAAVYRGVYFTKYRPDLTYSYESRDSWSFQDDNGYITGNVYWFKYEPVKWRILTENFIDANGVEKGGALLICDMILDSQDFYPSRSERTISGEPVYGNNYEYSTIRTWLNDTFYNTTFNTLEKELILNVTIDNSVASTGFETNECVCSNTNDNVFLPSYYEVTAYPAMDTSEERCLIASDYARSQGCYVMDSPEFAYYGYSNWRLRSPSYIEIVSNQVRTVMYGGGISNGYLVEFTTYGIAPAIVVDLN